jgi:hypothetical protein
MKKVVKKAIEHKVKLMWILVLASIAMLFLSPFNELKEKLIGTLPWVFLSLLVTEGLFTAGIVLMAASVEHDLGLNPLKWRKHLKTVLKHVPENQLFWWGFWINATGALGTGLVLSIAVITSLPATSWGIIILPFMDLGLTIALRATILELKKDITLEQA